MSFSWPYQSRRCWQCHRCWCCAGRCSRCSWSPGGAEQRRFPWPEQQAGQGARWLSPGQGHEQWCGPLCHRNQPVNRSHSVNYCNFIIVTGMPGKSYHRQLRSLLWYLCDVIRALINSLVHWLNFIIIFRLHYFLLLSRLTHVTSDSEWAPAAFIGPFLISTNAVYLFVCCMAGAMWNCCRLGASSVHTTQPCISLPCHCIWSHTCV